MKVLFLLSVNKRMFISVFLDVYAYTSAISISLALFLYIYLRVCVCAKAQLNETPEVLLLKPEASYSHSAFKSVCRFTAAQCGGRG